MAVLRFDTPCSLAISFLMIEAASTSETSVNFYKTTRRNNPEDSHLHIRRRENLKSQLVRLIIEFELFFTHHGSSPLASSDREPALKY
jgi:hypothetical protein